MTISVRPYEDADLPLLQSALAGWIREAGPCGYCHIGDLQQRIYAEVRGRRPLGELVRIWEDAGRIVGVAICFRFDAGFDLFVAPSHRGAGQELAMLEAARATTARLVRGAGGAAVITDVFGCDAARRELLVRLGFREYRTWDYVVERDLAAPIPEPQPPAGFVVRPAEHADAAELAAAHNSAFGAGWTPELYRDEVMRKPGYAPEREIVAVAPGGRIAAFTVISLDALNRVGLFEPVGTHAEFRRMGLARAMMLFAMREMRRQGMERARLSHAVDNLPAGALYAGLGFERRDQTFGYTRPLDDSDVSLAER